MPRMGDRSCRRVAACRRGLGPGLTPTNHLCETTRDRECQMDERESQKSMRLLVANYWLFYQPVRVGVR